MWVVCAAACVCAGYQIVADGHLGSVGGTSASAPAFAGMISLINEALLQKGGKQLGFLNPFLYKNEATGFTDVTVGASAPPRLATPCQPPSLHVRILHERPW